MQRLVCLRDPLVSCTVCHQTTCDFRKGVIKYGKFKFFGLMAVCGFNALVRECARARSWADACKSAHTMRQPTHQAPSQPLALNGAHQ